LAPQLRDLGHEGVDFILDCADPANLRQLIASLNPLGTICCILGGEATKSLDLSGLVAKRGTLTFELMFTRPRLGLEPERQGQILDQVSDLLDQKTLRTTMTRSLDWGSIREAHRAIEGGHTLGKIVLEIP
jgi:NADPH:quinone reductase-like Zn-dependent oxidoreductase